MHRPRSCSSFVWISTLLVLLSSISAMSASVVVWTTGHRSEVTKYLTEQLIPRAQKERRISVVIENVRMDTETRERLLSGQGPDVLIDSLGNMVELGRTNQLVQLTRYVSGWRDQRMLFSNLLQPPYPQLPRLDYEPLTMYGLPIEVSPSGIAYNKDAFAKAGLSPAAPPASWEELESAARKLALQFGGRTVRIGFDASWTSMDLFVNFLKLNNETGVTSDFRRARLDTQQAIDTFSYLSRLYQAAYPPSELLAGQPSRGNPSRFADGMTAMAYGGPNLAVSTKERNPRWQTELGFFAPRRSRSAAPAAWLSYKVIGIPNSTRDSRLAWEFIEWLMSPEIAVLYHVATGTLPSRSDVGSRISKAAPHLAGWYDAIKYGFVIETYPTIWNRNRDLILKGLTGQLDPRSVMYQINGAYQLALDELWADLQSSGWR
ncbi:MAG: extracellular solute-binding protein [Limnochordia bacterium]|jgi:ABC-type glycerol-3-phosphate transport system substrate-binding protein